MTDELDTRIRSFMIELLDDRPQAPPFHHAGTVVIRDGRKDGREPMLGTKKREETQEPTSPRRRGPVIASAVFAGILVMVPVVGILVSGGDAPEPQPAAATSTTVVQTSAAPEPEATTTTALSGPALEGAAGVVGLTFDTIDGPGTEPDKIVFNEDGTFRVVDQFRNVDSGVYTTNGDEITFESDAAAHEPTSDVRWFHAPALNINNNTCEGVVGNYTLTWETSTRLVLDVTSDGCPRRLSAANGLELELASE